MTRALLRLPAWQHRLLHLSALTLLLSGLGWLLLHQTLGAGAGELPHPAEPWLMRLHGAAAFAALFALGVVAGSHIPAGWRMTQHLRHHPPSRSRSHSHSHSHSQRRSGLALCALAAALVASGYVLYYFSPEDWRDPIGWLHAALGLAATAAGAWHQRRARRWGSSRFTPS